MTIRQIDPGREPQYGLHREEDRKGIGLCSKEGTGMENQSVKRRNRHDLRGTIRTLIRAIHGLQDQVQEQRREIAAMRREGVPLRSQSAMCSHCGGVGNHASWCMYAPRFATSSDPTVERIRQIQERLTGRE